MVHWIGYILLYVVYYVTLKQAFPSESMVQAARNMWLFLCMYKQCMTMCTVSCVKSVVMSTTRFHFYILLNAFKMVPLMLRMGWRWQWRKQVKRERHGAGKEQTETDAEWQLHHNRDRKRYNVRKMSLMQAGMNSRPRKSFMDEFKEWIDGWTGTK